MSEREIIVKAIDDSPNLNVAARKLGASRRTLQNRMRQYGLPYGKSGRPKETLPIKHWHLPHPSGAADLLFICGAGAGLYFAHRWLTQSGNKSTVLGDAHTNAYLAGINAQIL